VAGWIDFRRLRPNAAWRVFQRRQVTEGGAEPSVEPLDRSQQPGGPMLLGEFCTNMPQLLTSTEGEFTHYGIGPSAAGADGTFTVFSGFVQRAHGLRWALEPGDTADFAANVLAPVEHLNFDLLVHRSLPFVQGAQLQLSSAAFNDGRRRSPYDRLPIEADCEDLGSPPLLASARVPRLNQVVDRVFERGGWKLDEFVGLRFEVAYPPFPSVAVLRCPLQPRSS
jgi:hypothetical protein